MTQSNTSGDSSRRFGKRSGNMIAAMVIVMIGIGMMITVALLPLGAVVCVVGVVWGLIAWVKTRSTNGSHVKPEEKGIAY